MLEVNLRGLLWSATLFGSKAAPGTSPRTCSNRETGQLRSWIVVAAQGSCLLRPGYAMSPAGCCINVCDRQGSIRPQLLATLERECVQRTLPRPISFGWEDYAAVNTQCASCCVKLLFFVTCDMRQGSLCLLRGHGWTSECLLELDSR